MVKKVKEYKPGDFVFAKVKGYPAWPARVRSVKGKKYTVLFYGTNETANLPGNVIFDYVGNKDKFLSKSNKRKEFLAGVKQIEKEIADGTELPPEDENQPEVDTNDSTADNTGTGDDTVNNDGEDTGVDNTADGSEDTLETTNVSQRDEPEVPDSEDGALVIDESKKKGLKRSSSTVANGATKPKQTNKQEKKDAPAAEESQDQNSEGAVNIPEN